MAESDGLWHCDTGRAIVAFMVSLQSGNSIQLRVAEKIFRFTQLPRRCVANGINGLRYNRALRGRCVSNLNLDMAFTLLNPRTVSTGFVKMN